MLKSMFLIVALMLSLKSFGVIAPLKIGEIVTQEIENSKIVAVVTKEKIALSDLAFGSEILDEESLPNGDYRYLIVYAEAAEGMAAMICENECFKHKLVLAAVTSHLV